MITQRIQATQRAKILTVIFNNQSIDLINTSKDFLFISRKDAEQNYKSLFKAELSKIIIYILKLKILTLGYENLIIYYYKKNFILDFISLN